MVCEAFDGSDTTLPTVPTALPPRDGAVTGSPSRTLTSREIEMRALPPPRQTASAAAPPTSTLTDDPPAKISLTTLVRLAVSETVPTTNPPSVTTRLPAATESVVPVPTRNVP